MGYLLAPKALKDQLRLPSFDFSFGDMGGALRDLPGGLPEFPSFEFPPFPEMPEYPDIAAILEGIIPTDLAAPVVPDIGGIIEELLKGFNLYPGIDKGEPKDTTLPETPTGWEWFTGLHPFAQNVLAVAGGGAASYGAFKGIQTVAPAGKTIFGGLADTFVRFLRGTKPKAPVGKPPIPAGVNPKLWMQWVKHTGLGKVAGRGLAGGLWGFAAIPVEWAMPPEELAEIRKIGAYGSIWDNLVAIFTGKTLPQYPGAEKGFIPAESDFRRGRTITYPEFSYERDKAPTPTKTYGGIEKGVTPPTPTPKRKQYPVTPEFEAQFGVKGARTPADLGGF